MTRVALRVLLVAAGGFLVGCSDDAPEASTGAGGSTPLGETCPAAGPDVPLDSSILENDRVRLLPAFPFTASDPKPITVILPSDYDPTGAYPVLYFTDGQELDTMQVETAHDGLVADGLIEPHIIVAVTTQGDERGVVLTPDADPDGGFSFGDGGGGDDFAGELVNLVKPFIDHHFATRCGREHTAIGGYSLGGLLCMHALMRDPEVFGRGVCMSPSFWWNGRSIVDRYATFDGPLPHRLWIDVGTLEGPSENFITMEPDEDHWGHPEAIRSVRNLAIDKGMDLGGAFGFHEPLDVPHTFGDAGARMRSALAFALSDVSLVDATPASHALGMWNSPILTAPAHPSFSKSTLSFELSFEEPFALTVPNRDLTLASSSDAVATIAADGTITAVAPGTATMTASYEGLEASGDIVVADGN